MAKNLKLNEINVNNLHQLGKPAQIGLAVAVIVFVWVLAYFALFRNQFTQIDTLKQEELTLKESYTQKSIQAASLDNLKLELAQIRSAFNILLKQLPTDAEIPNLIQELHQAGATNGMRMNSVTPKAPIIDGPIQKLPYSISLTGSYEQLSQFTRDVGRLSRIVTLDTLNLRTDAKGNSLTLDALANTYQASALTSEQDEPKPQTAEASATAAPNKKQ